MLISIPCVLMALLAAPEIKPTLIAPRAERAEVAALPTEWFVGHDRGFEIAASLHSALLAHETERARVQISVADLGLVTLSLHRVRAVTSDARVESGVSKRALSATLTNALHGVVHFEGSVEGVDHSSVYLGIGTTGVNAIIDLGEGRGLFTMRRINNESSGLCAGLCEFVRSSGTSAPDVPSCGGAHVHDNNEGGGVAGFGSVPPGARRVVELAIDTDYDYYNIFHDSVSATEYLSTLVGAVSAIYRRDCDASIRVSYVRLQTDAADLFNDSDPLGPFRDYWNENGTGVQRDLFTFLSGRRNLPYGGVAWLNAACMDYGYSVNGYMVGTFADAIVTNPGNWDVNVLAHELGHNLGTYHTHDYGVDACASGTIERGTIMSYCHVVQGASSNIDLRFHSVTAANIENFLVNAPCLATDCDDDGVVDAEEIAGNSALDGNSDGILDACQDCNSNGVTDPVEIALGLLVDLDNDLHPDVCEADCNANGSPDSLEIALDATIDHNGDFVLDACEVDCDGNGIADSVDIRADMNRDISRDGRLDACESCTGSGVTDFVALQGSRSRWVASAGDSMLRELDPRSGVVRRTVACGLTPASDLAIGGDGRLYASVGTRIYALHRVNDVSASVWSVELPAAASAIALAPSGQLAVLLTDGRVLLLAANGTISATFVATGLSSDARDLVFRTLTDGTRDALVSYSGGVISRHAWPVNSASVLVDATAAAPQFRGMFAQSDGSFLVGSATEQGILRYSAAGVALGVWDVENGAMLTSPHSMCASGDGRAVLASSANSSSTVNGYNLGTGYTERTYRIYPSDAPSATAIVIAPPSASDSNGNLIPDACEVQMGDINGDGVVNGADLAALLNAWGSCSGCAADLNGDSIVGGADLALLLNAWS